MDKIEVWILPVVLFFACLFTLSFVWMYLHRRLQIWAEKTTSQIDDQIIDLLKSPVRIGIFLVSLQLFFQYSPLGAQSAILKTITHVIMVFMFTMVIGKTLHLVLDTKLADLEMDLTTRGFFKNALWALLITISSLIVLDTLGISITPLLASLGVGSLAVGLALQDTLSNFFSGIYIIADKPCRVGDFIRIDSETEGHVIKIGWRSSHLRLINDNMVVVPNSKLASAQLVNFDLGGSECSISIQAGVAYNSDLNHVETVALQVARAIVSKYETELKQKEVLFRFFNFGESSVDFKLSIRVKSWADQAEIRHHLIKALHQEFSNQKIEIPFPHRVLQIQGNADLKA